MDLDLMLADLERLVEAESPSDDPAALRRCASQLATLVRERLGTTATIHDDASVTWRHDTGSPPVLLLGHLDTVWPLGTIDRLPFRVADGLVRGPGTFDMKAGLVVALHALMACRDRGALPSVELLVTSDEEVGSLRSRPTIEAAARRCGRVLVLEPCGPGGAVKTARKGVALGRVRALGRASHAGLDPEAGINAVVGLAAVIPMIAAAGDADRGTTVTPTVIAGGTTVNTVPAAAEVAIDMRFLDDDEVDRVRRDLEALAPAGEVELTVTLDRNRPALAPAASAPLREALAHAAAAVGRPIDTVTVGGASDGNLAAAAGASVLDGLGPEGDGAHAEHEHVIVDGLVRRVDLLAHLIPAVAAVPPNGGTGARAPHGV